MAEQSDDGLEEVVLQVVVGRPLVEVSHLKVPISPHYANHSSLQPADIGWPTGNGKKLSNCQACCLAQVCLAAA